MKDALRIGLCAAKANAVPMVALWTVSVALVAGYYLFSDMQSALDCLGRFQRDYGIWAGFSSQFVFCGVIPCVFRMSVAEVRTERPVLKSLLQSLWSGCWGIVSVGFYAVQARLFGAGSDFATLAANHPSSYAVVGYREVRSWSTLRERAFKTLAHESARKRIRRLSEWIAAIAAFCGYKTDIALRKAFRLLTGMSLADWRKANR